jgi:hypothetical protein
MHELLLAVFMVNKIPIPQGYHQFAGSQNLIQITLVTIQFQVLAETVHVGVVGNPKTLVEDIIQDPIAGNSFKEIFNLLN